jgi:hypothetical protein
MGKNRSIKKPAGQEEQWRIPEKRMRGQGIFYEQPKSETVKLCLTPAGKARLMQLASLSKLSMSEYLERWLMGNSDKLFLP